MQVERAILTATVSYIDLVKRRLAVLIEAPLAKVMRAEAMEDGNTAAENAFVLKLLLAVLFAARCELLYHGRVYFSDRFVSSIIHLGDRYILDSLSYVFPHHFLNDIGLLFQVENSVNQL